MLGENHKYKHDRSNRIADSENERIINFVQTENGIPKLLWEEEIYTNFEYFKISQHFYCFPGLNCNVGFNFAFNDEALKFELVTKKIANQVNINQGDKKAIAPSAPSSAKNAAPLSPTSRLERTDSKKINIYDSFKAQKKLIDKNHIGSPTSFKHVNHIGLSADNNFEIKLDVQDGDQFFINQILQQLNLKPNRKTLEYANKFMESNGGLQKYLQAFQEHSQVVTSEKEKSSKLKRQSSGSTNGSVKSDISRRAFKLSKKMAPRPHALEVVANLQTSLHSQQNYSNSVLPSPVTYSANKIEYQKEENEISSFRHSSHVPNSIPNLKEKDSSNNQIENRVQYSGTVKTKFHSFKLAAPPPPPPSTPSTQVSSQSNEPPSIQTLLSTFVPPEPSFKDYSPLEHSAIPPPPPPLNVTAFENEKMTLKMSFIPPPPPPLPNESFSGLNHDLEIKSSNSDKPVSAVHESSSKTNRLQKQISDNTDIRSEFLRSIENFNGKLLRHVDKQSDDSKENHTKNNVMNSLLTALDKMRPYLKDSSDEDDENNDEKEQIPQVIKKHF